MTSVGDIGIKPGEAKSLLRKLCRLDETTGVEEPIYPEARRDVCAIRFNESKKDSEGCWSSSNVYLMYKTAERLNSRSLIACNGFGIMFELREIAEREGDIVVLIGSHCGAGSYYHIPGEVWESKTNKKELGLK